MDLRGLWLPAAKRPSRDLSSRVRPSPFGERGKKNADSTHRDAAFLKCLHQRIEARTIAAPALDRTLVERLSDLRDARGFHRPIRFVEFQATLVPRKAQEGDDFLRLCLGIEIGRASCRE